ncbi:MAG: diguanylate cyclase [Spirochaetaceae bacterium]
MSTRRADQIVPQSIRGRVLSLALLPLLLVLAVSAGLFLLLITPEILNDQKDQLRQTTIAQREFFYQWREERLADLRFVSALVKESGGAPRRQPSVRELFLNNQTEFTSIDFYDPVGYLMEANERSGVYIGDRPFFQRALRGRAALSDILIDRRSRIPMIVFAYPVMDESEEVSRVLVAGVPITTLLNALETTSRVAQGRTLLVDGEGRIVSDDVVVPLYESRPQPQPRVFPSELSWTGVRSRVKPQVMEHIRRGARTSGPYRNRNDELVVAAYASLVLGEWYLVSESPVEMLVESLRTYLLAGLGTAAIFLLLFLPVLLIVSRTIERPIMDLAAFSREINRETYDTDVFPRLPRNAPREIRVLFATFSEMVHRLKEHMRDLEHTAITDPLSGLPNRRFLLAEGQRAVAMCLEQRRPVSVLMVDIDFFKRINDEYGHEVGDEAIRSAAATISASTRETDFVARYGGEEFTVVAPFADRQEAIVLGERIRLACSSRPVTVATAEKEREAPAVPVWITVSVGGATALPDDSVGAPYDAAPKLLESLIADADNALYRAKREGRNRVVAT